MKTIQLDTIEVGERLREDLGDLGDLMASIQQYGLLHPVVIDDDRRLIAGHRRLESCRRLGKKQVEVKFLGDLSAEERREIELEENVRRKDLTEYERSKKTKELAEVAKKVAETELCGSDPHKSKRRGRPKEASRRTAAERTGVDEATIRHAEDHVAAGEKYPFMQRAGWSQKHALVTAKKLDALPVKDRRRICMIIDASEPPPTDAARMVEAFSELSASQRKKVHDMTRDKDERVRSAGVTFLAKTAPVPDPRAVYLGGVSKELLRQSKRFKSDPLNDRLVWLAEKAAELRTQIQDAHKKRVKEVSNV